MSHILLMQTNETAFLEHEHHGLSRW